MYLRDLNPSGCSLRKAAAEKRDTVSLGCSEFSITNSTEKFFLIGISLHCLVGIHGIHSYSFLLKAQFTLLLWLCNLKLSVRNEEVCSDFFSGIFRESKIKPALSMRTEMINLVSFRSVMEY